MNWIIEAKGNRMCSLAQLSFNWMIGENGDVDIEIVYLVPLLWLFCVLNGCMLIHRKNSRLYRLEDGLKWEKKIKTKMGLRLVASLDACMLTKSCDWMQKSYKSSSVGAFYSDPFHYIVNVKLENWRASLWWVTCHVSSSHG